MVHAVTAALCLPGAYRVHGTHSVTATYTAVVRFVEQLAALHRLLMTLTHRTSDLGAYILGKVGRPSLLLAIGSSMHSPV